MKTIGLLGGMSWESTALYYRALNRGVNERLGGQHSARILLHSVDFEEIQALQQADAWDEAGDLLGDAARALEGAGADFLVLCTNTMHRVAPRIEAAVSIPLLHIADATAREVRAQGISVVGLLGTRFTMEQDFYRGRLEREHGLRVLVPEPDERALVDRVIYQELVRGQKLEASRKCYAEILEGLVAQGARGVILGCTEIGMLVGPADAPVPLFDTGELHARAALARALGDDAD